MTLLPRTSAALLLAILALQLHPPGTAATSSFRYFLAASKTSTAAPADTPVSTEPADTLARTDPPDTLASTDPAPSILDKPTPQDAPSEEVQQDLENRTLLASGVKIPRVIVNLAPELDLTKRIPPVQTSPRVKKSPYCVQVHTTATQEACNPLQHLAEAAVASANLGNAAHTFYQSIPAQQQQQQVVQVQPQQQQVVQVQPQYQQVVQVQPQHQQVVQFQPQHQQVVQVQPQHQQVVQVQEAPQQVVQVQEQSQQLVHVAPAPYLSAPSYHVAPSFQAPPAPVIHTPPQQISYGGVPSYGSYNSPSNSGSAADTSFQTAPVNHFSPSTITSHAAPAPAGHFSVAPQTPVFVSTPQASPAYSSPSIFHQPAPQTPIFVHKGGYGEPGQVLSQPAPVHVQQPAPTYGGGSYQAAPTISVSAPAPQFTYQQPIPPTFQPAPTYGNSPPPTPTFHQYAPSYGHSPPPTPTFHQPRPQPPPPSFHQPAPSYGHSPPPSPVFHQPAPAYGSAQPNIVQFHQPSTTFGNQPVNNYHSSYGSPPTHRPAPVFGPAPTFSPPHKNGEDSSAPQNIQLMTSFTSAGAADQQYRDDDESEKKDLNQQTDKNSTSLDSSPRDTEYDPPSTYHRPNFFEQPVQHQAQAAFAPAPVQHQFVSPPTHTTYGQGSTYGSAPAQSGAPSFYSAPSFNLPHVHAFKPPPSQTHFAASAAPSYSSAPPAPTYSSVPPTPSFASAPSYGSAPPTYSFASAPSPPQVQYSFSPAPYSAPVQSFAPAQSIVHIPAPSIIQTPPASFATASYSPSPMIHSRPSYGFVHHSYGSPVPTYGHITPFTSHQSKPVYTTANTVMFHPHGNSGKSIPLSITCQVHPMTQGHVVPAAAPVSHMASPGNFQEASYREADDNDEAEPQDTTPTPRDEALQDKGQNSTSSNSGDETTKKPAGPASRADEKPKSPIFSPQSKFGQQIIPPNLAQAINRAPNSNARSANGVIYPPPPFPQFGPEYYYR